MPARWAERRDASTHMLSVLGEIASARAAAACRSASTTASAAMIAATCSGDGLPPTTSALHHSGALPCLRAGSCSRFVRSIANALHEHLARVARIDDVVDVAALGRLVRVEEPLVVLEHRARPGARSGSAATSISRRKMMFTAARGAHHRDLGRRPRVRDVGADRLRVHDDVRAAVALARDDLHARHRRLAVRVEQLGAVADDAAVLLVGAGKEPGDVDEGDERDVERVARAHEPRGLLRRVDVEAHRRAPAAGCRRCRRRGRRCARSRTRCSSPRAGTPRRSRRRRRSRRSPSSCRTAGWANRERGR